MHTNLTRLIYDGIHHNRRQSNHTLSNFASGIHDRVLRVGSLGYSFALVQNPRIHI